MNIYYLTVSMKQESGYSLGGWLGKQLPHGSTGKDLIPSFLTWLLAGFSSLCTQNESLSFSLAVV